MFRFDLPADEKPPVPVVPTVGPFNLPPTRLAVHASEKWLLATPPDVSDDPATRQPPLDVRVVVPFVQTAVTRMPPSPWRMARRVVDRGNRHPLVVNVRSAQDKAQRNPASIRQDVPLRPALRPVRGVRSRKSPPFGAFTIKLSRDAHVHEIPFRTW